MTPPSIQLHLQVNIEGFDRRSFNTLQKQTLAIPSFLLCPIPPTTLLTFLTIKINSLPLFLYPTSFSG